MTSVRESAESSFVPSCDEGGTDRRPIFQIGWWPAADFGKGGGPFYGPESARCVPNELPNSLSNRALGILPHRISADIASISLRVSLNRTGCPWNCMASSDLRQPSRDFEHMPPNNRNQWTFTAITGRRERPIWAPQMRLQAAVFKGKFQWRRGWKPISAPN